MTVSSVARSRSS